MAPKAALTFQQVASWINAVATGVIVFPKPFVIVGSEASWEINPAANVFLWILMKLPRR